MNRPIRCGPGGAAGPGDGAQLAPLLGIRGRSWCQDRGCCLRRGGPAGAWVSVVAGELRVRPQAVSAENSSDESL